ncbi:hypothetical protein JoomaDRAFT_2600 [Galbibacter orientalis DSM 19592]|uniref:DUF1343 domain-containing protein n=1 Tax=Galbibacter orientalis DSM 19592 TaxID=926559 RepID=I3C7I1_9FLAO|nr:DUF1343 domain-containing protein [Galbibacter orientalis]EIJ39574.1 hypothetical protein JoomaDRAFT_2600 [Galbibacter orientalis DSM 19592]
MKTNTGLDRLVNDTSIQSKYQGNVALLCHNASVDGKLNHAALLFKNIFGDRFIKLFGPQHGFSTDAQDNMIETNHFIHPYFNIPVYSLYSETRIPTDEMLENINYLFIDLQDVGCRMYTYIYTVTHILNKCAERDIEIVILDRPNPINGIDIEGNILDEKFSSFIGLHPLPVRHGLTIAEVALMHQEYWANKKCNLSIISMKNWNRTMYYKDTGLSWLLPSPNLPRAISTLTFPTTVLFEGTKLSEGRGTTQSLEIVGSPKIEAFGYYKNHLEKSFAKSGLKGVVLRPITFLPTFQKNMNRICGGFQIHVTDSQTFKPWRTGQFLMKEFYHYLGKDFEWKEPPYEYDYKNMPIDIINGTDKLRKWVTTNGTMEDLENFENLKEYKTQIASILLYK